jgi:prophage maintenance system killer protein
LDQCQGVIPDEGDAQKPESLKRQLERVRMERALEVVESMASRRVLLTTTELARLNNILTGNNDDPWRREPVNITLPSGKVETLALIANPHMIFREKLHRATETAEAGSVIDAAVDIYVELVLSHMFKDANRRTAAIAAHYFLQRYGVPLSGTVLHDIGLGNLREEGEIDSLRETIRQMAKFVTKRNPPG